MKFPSETFWIGVALTIGSAMLVFGVFGRGWVRAGGAEAFPSSFGAESATTTVLESVLQDVERAVQTGDVGQLRALLTPRYFDELEQQRSALGGDPLNGFGLHDIASMVGDLNVLQFSVGRASGAVAVIAYRVTASTGPATVERRRRIQAFRFVLGAGRVRLDTKRAMWLERDREQDWHQQVRAVADAMVGAR